MRKFIFLFSALLATSSAFAATILTYEAQCFRSEYECRQYRDFFDMRDSYSVGMHASICRQSTLPPDLSVPRSACPRGQWGYLPYVKFQYGTKQAARNPLRSFCTLLRDTAERFANSLSRVHALNGKSYFISEVRKVSEEEKLKFRHTECEDSRFLVEMKVHWNK
jgi:hypothetical protein